MTRTTSTRIRLPRGPITLAHLEANLPGALIKLEHDPERVRTLVALMMKLSVPLLRLLERDVRAARLDAQQLRALRRARRRSRTPASNTH